MAKKTLYKTKVTITVIHEEENAVINCSLGELLAEGHDGDFSISATTTKPTTIKGKVAAKEVMAQGSDPEFFQMDSDGNELEDY